MGKLADSPGFWIAVLIVVLLFGSKKLPDAARGVGRSLRIFKAETKGLINDETAPAPPPAAPVPPQAIAPAQPVVSPEVNHPAPEKSES
jgi:sec-independent protein translocase protein TatA